MVKMYSRYGYCLLRQVGLVMVMMILVEMMTTELMGPFDFLNGPMHSLDSP